MLYSWIFLFFPIPLVFHSFVRFRWKAPLAFRNLLLMSSVPPPILRDFGNQVDKLCDIFCLIAPGSNLGHPCCIVLDVLILGYQQRIVICEAKVFKYTYHFLSPPLVPRHSIQQKPRHDIALLHPRRYFKPACQSHCNKYSITSSGPYWVILLDLLCEFGEVRWLTKI